MRRAICVVLLLTAAVARQAAADRATQALRTPGAIRDRVMIARWGAVGLRPEARAPSDHGDDDPRSRAFPVVAMTEQAARVLVEDDQARLLVWIAADDLAWTVAKPTRVRGRGAVGVWALPGAPLTISGDGARVAVRLVADDVTVEGTVARRALARQFRPGRRPPLGDGATRAFRASPDGPTLVRFADPVAVRIIDTGHGDWVLVEHVDATVRVVGWAHRRALADDAIHGFGSGSGYGYGLSDTDHVALDAGACLFDDRGAAVGVQLTPGSRYAHDLGGGRWSVYVGTPWRLLEAVAIDRAAGGGAPRWQGCP